MRYAANGGFLGIRRAPSGGTAVGRWSVQDLFESRAAGIWPDDPYWSSVVLLAMNDSRADGTFIFDDASNSENQLFNNGNVQWDTAQAPTGLTSSGLFDGSGGYLSSADSADWHFGSGDFTVEAWIRFNSVATVQVFFSQWLGTANQKSWQLYFNTTNALEFTTSSTGANQTVHSVSWTPSTGTWYHIAVIRTGTTIRFFVNGAQVGADKTDSSTFFNASTPLIIGGNEAGTANYFNGWMASFRITKGVARYTAAFTVPSLPLPTA